MNDEEQKSADDENSESEAALLERRRQAIAAIRENSKGNVLGPDLTIKQLIEDGRKR